MVILCCATARLVTYLLFVASTAIHFTPLYTHPPHRGYEYDSAITEVFRTPPLGLIFPFFAGSLSRMGQL
jgi:hypothetical protein